MKEDQFDDPFIFDLQYTSISNVDCKYQSDEFVLFQMNSASFPTVLFVVSFD